MAEPILLSNVRLSFPHLVEPRKNDLNPAAAPKYGCDLIMAPNHQGFAQFMQMIQKDAAAKWGENAAAVMQMINSDRKMRCFGSGAEKIDKKTFKPYAGYEGQVYIAAYSDRQPQMIQADGIPIDSNNTMAYQMLARKLYGGCYVNVAIKPWLQENKHGRGIRCDLIAIQFAGDGEAFGEGSVDTTGMFGAVAATPAPAVPQMPSFLGG